jgi:hypothetical protein
MTIGVLAKNRGGVKPHPLSGTFVTPIGALGQSTVTLNPVILREVGTPIAAAKAKVDSAPSNEVAQPRKLQPT